MHGDSFKGKLWLFHHNIDISLRRSRKKMFSSTSSFVAVVKSEQTWHLDEIQLLLNKIEENEN